MKKWIICLSALLVVTLICVSLLPMNAQAAVTSGKCGDNLTWTFDSGMRILTISGTGAMWDFDPKEGNKPEWDSCDIFSVEIKEGVTSVGNYAFSGKRFIASTILPNTVTSLGDYAFNGCNRMSKINLHNNITYIGEGALYGCSLEKVTIPEKIKIIEKDVAI